METMPITLGSNIASFRGQRQLTRTSHELGTVFQRLATGQRINKASDDAAGLSIADSLNAQSRIFNQGVRNLSDGLSLLSIADSALENLSSIVVRLEELAAQSANGVYNNKQRKGLDAEAQALSKEFFRISKTTEFNGQSLLSGDNPSISLQAGSGQNAILAASVGGAIGTGTFGAATSFRTYMDNSSGELKLGDLNGDGLLDLVTAVDYFSSGVLAVALGTGGGSFGPVNTYYSNSSNCSHATLGDVNGDGILDVVTNEEGGNTGVRLGLGDGTFSDRTNYNSIHGVRSVELGDLNGDGLLDLVSGGTMAGGFVTVRLGLGGGTFASAVSYTAEGVSSAALALGDLNGDNILDLVTSGYNGGGNHACTIRLGAGDGTFKPSTSFALAGAQSAIELGDLNNDGALDIVCIGGTSLGVAIGTGAGTFGAVTSYSSGGSDGVLVDFDGDGFLDLAVGGGTIRLGTGTGLLGSSTNFSMNPGGNDGIAAGDLNGDGVLDIISSGNDSGGFCSVTARMGITTSGVAPLLPFSLQSIADARQALPVFKHKHEQLAAQRGEIGAFQSRINVARTVLEVSSENFKAAESRIRDADLADESSRLIRLNILQQAASSILAQSNQQPALALQLLSA